MIGRRKKEKEQNTHAIRLVLTVRLKKADVLIELHIVSGNYFNPLPEFLQLLLKLLHLLQKGKNKIIRNETPY